MAAITHADGGDGRMINCTSVRVHHSAATSKKIATLTDADSLPVKIVITPRQTLDAKAEAGLLANTRQGQMARTDRAHDADWLRAMIAARGGWANIPPGRNRRNPLCLSPWLHRQRKLIETFFNKFKCQCRLATRQDKTGPTFHAVAMLACIRLRPRHHDSAALKRFALRSHRANHSSIVFYRVFRAAGRFHPA